MYQKSGWPNIRSFFTIWYRIGQNVERHQMSQPDISITYMTYPQ